MPLTSITACFALLYMIVDIENMHLKVCCLCSTVQNTYMPRLHELTLQLFIYPDMQFVPVCQLLHLVA